jgi:hypothetical protein
MDWLYPLSSFVVGAIVGGQSGKSRLNLPSFYFARV